MSSKVKITLNYAAVGQLMKSPEMQSILSEHARSIAAACGDGYSSDVYVGKTRANAMVKTDTVEAYYDNLKNNTIMKHLR